MIAALHPHRRRLRAEDRLPEHHRVRRLQRGLHEAGDVVHGMLAVRIHGQHMGEAGGLGFLQAGEDGRALAAIVRQRQDAQAGIGDGEVGEPPVRAVGAAVDHHPDRVPGGAGGADGVDHPRAGIVGRDQDEMGGRGGGRGHAG
jgi:hypothetical protein